MLFSLTGPLAAPTRLNLTTAMEVTRAASAHNVTMVVVFYISMILVSVVVKPMVPAPAAPDSEAAATVEASPAGAA